MPFDKIVKYEKVTKDWNGDPDRFEEEEKTNVACVGQSGGCYFIRHTKRNGIRGIEISCLFCDRLLNNGNPIASNRSKNLKSLIKQGKLAKRPSRAKRGAHRSPVKTRTRKFRSEVQSLENFKNKTKKDFEKAVAKAIQEDLLSIELCCPFVQGDDGCILARRDKTVCLTWSKNAVERGAKVKGPIKSLKGFQSENRRDESWSYDFPNCPLEGPENCRIQEGTGCFNSIGKLVHDFSSTGMNLISIDLDENTHCVQGLSLLAFSFAKHMERLKIASYFEAIMIALKEGPHEIIGQVFVQQRQAVVIDPDEGRKFTLPKPPKKQKMNDGVEYQSSGLWLKNPENRQIIEDQFELFGVTKVIYGTNSRGLASPTSLFKQHKNSCNVTVILGVFFLGIGYKKIPRFPERFERALFCRLKRSKKCGDFPDFLKQSLEGEENYRDRLEKELENYVKSEDNKFRPKYFTSV